MPSPLRIQMPQRSLPLKTCAVHEFCWVGIKRCSGPQELAKLADRIRECLKNEQRFRDLPEGLQHPIEGVLFRVRVEPAKQVRGRHFLEFDGCDHAQDFIPLLKHNLVIRIASGLDLPTDGGEKVCPAKVSRNG
jgi:hypothetical protein